MYSKTFFEGTDAEVTVIYKDCQFKIKHNKDGPAFEHVDGSKEWWVNGKRHREDGPAIESANRYKGYWLEGVEYSYYQYCDEMDKRRKFGGFI